MKRSKPDPELLRLFKVELNRSASLHGISTYTMLQKEGSSELIVAFNKGGADNKYYWVNYITGEVSDHSAPNSDKAIISEASAAARKQAANTKT